MFSFEYPYVLALIIVVFACLFFCQEKKLSIYFPYSENLKTLVKSKQLLRNSLKFLALSLVIIALASPITTKEIILDNSKGYEISLILDASGSMQESNKFGVVKKILVDFIKQRKTDKLALSIFADFAYTAVPLTYDKKSIIEILSHIDVGIAGQQRTALYEALFLSSKLFKGSHSKEKIAILLTDGIDNAGSVPLEVAMNRAKSNKIKVYTIGIGNAGDFNAGILREIAQGTGAEFFSANSIQGIKDIYMRINRLEKSKININKYEKKAYYFYYPLGLALMLLFLYFWQRNTWILNK
ncbi:BatA (Bacteroides aerotolerance operon) [bacterium endosymbiont of Bathymodiolus sp. 5 South]|nr:Aerotolerance protein BatA [uncultured Gammaproteobacteria bacterium]CAC9660881.1 Aerotolerance protein BatA [uncultured Gammaproteobacteria bacterium]SHN92026.1 BatA (Bacteroides aerotolerance operon) [bacterium endosymbiont of Bathymodiolus sp. 5 South]VVH59970.1 BatA (Bacteroides aerotolerance operon) [uncultured Gammaproteobacteria bacterium]